MTQPSDHILADVLGDLFRISDVTWLGRQRDWMTLSPRTVTSRGRDVPATQTEIRFDRLEASEGYDRHREIVDGVRALLRRGEWAPITMIEMFSSLMGGGPKIFAPNDEQWESMEQVEMKMPVRDFRMPYPAMAVVIPQASRARLASQYNLPAGVVPRKVFVRGRCEGQEPPSVTAFMGQIDSGHTVFYQFIEHPLNTTIESALTRDVTDGLERHPDGRFKDDGRDGMIAAPNLFGFGLVSARAAMNLAMMLTHFGCKLKAPEGTPGGMRAKDRAKMLMQRAADEKKGRVWQAVELSQHIVVRKVDRPTGMNPQGLGSGSPRKPGWIKGHWCAYPGRADARARGEQVPLYFRRPHWCNLHLVEGDLSQATATYEGKK